MRVLVVDDEYDICMMTCRILSQKGITCEYALNVSQAQDKIGKDKYDLYILDVRLPDGTGFDLVEPIWQREAGARIIIMSAFEDKETLERAKLLEVEQFVQKPFSKSEIIRLVEGYS